MAPGNIHSAAKKQRNPAVEQCFKLLTSKPLSPKSFGKPTPGGLKKPYPENIPDWMKDHKTGDVYYRVAVRNGIFELHENDKLPSRLHRDPKHSEVAILKKRYGNKLVQAQVNNCRKNKCGYGLYYRSRKLPQPKTSKIDYDALIRRYRPPKNSTNSMLSIPFPSTAEFAAAVNRYRRIEAYRRLRKALPRQIRECYPTIREFRRKLNLIEELHKEYQLVEDTTTDWLTVETTTKPIAEEIKNYYMPDPDSLSPAEWRYLRKQIYTALKIGMAGDEIIDIASDLSRPRKRIVGKKIKYEWLTAQGFVHAFTTIVNLNMAKQLHIKNIDEHGIGISENFENVVDTTVKNIRDRRLSFEELSKAPTETGIGASYYSTKNLFALHSLKERAKIDNRYGGMLSTTVHESTHSFHDSEGRRLTWLQDEGYAYNNGYKAGFLSARMGPDYLKYVYLSGIYTDIRGMLFDVWDSEHTSKAKCLGLSKTVIDYYQYNSSRWKKVREGYGKELGGEYLPHIHDANQSIVAQLELSSPMLMEVSAESREFGNLHNSGEHAAVEDQLSTACSTFYFRRSRLADNKLSSKTGVRNAIQLLVDLATIHGALLFLEPAALDKFNDIVEQRYFPFITEMLYTLPDISNGL